MFCCTYCNHLDGEERELIALLNLSSWCLVMVERLFLAVPRGCLQFVIVVFPGHTHLLFLSQLQHNTFSFLLEHRRHYIELFESYNSLIKFA